jgi:rhodanese-related sulfurtransferase
MYFVAYLSVALTFASSNAWASDYADESKDFGVSEMKNPKGPPYGSATPLTIPGAKTITTEQLKDMLGKEPKPVLIDALAASDMIEGAEGLGNGIGEQRMFGKDRSMFPKALQSLTAGDKARPVVFYCRSSSCWHSYNASLHAVSEGYSNVFWYRGGLDAWKASGGKAVPYALSKSAQ